MLLISSFALSFVLFRADFVGLNDSWVSFPPGSLHGLLRPLTYRPNPRNRLISVGKKKEENAFTQPDFMFPSRADFVGLSDSWVSFPPGSLRGLLRPLTYRPNPQNRLTFRSEKKRGGKCFYAARLHVYSVSSAP